MSDLPRPSFVVEVGQPEPSTYGGLNQSLAVHLTHTRKNLLESFEDEAECYEESYDSTADDCIKVFLRVRPFTAEELRKKEMQDCILLGNYQNVSLTAPVDSMISKNDIHRNGHKTDYVFTFSRVFGPGVTQQEFYQETAEGVVKEFLFDQNCLLFTYGVTNAGKTYTMQGIPDDQGILPRAMHHIFGELKTVEQSPKVKPHLYNDVVQLTPDQQSEDLRKKKLLMKLVEQEQEHDQLLLSVDAEKDKTSISSVRSSHSSCSEAPEVNQTLMDCSQIIGTNYCYSVWISFVEIYNESILDLLVPLTAADLRKRSTLKLSEDRRGNIFVKGAQEINVTCAEEAYKLLLFGKKNLKFASTRLNYNSSRSHCIFTVKLLKAGPNPSTKPIVNRLSFCDLAGSERSSKADSFGERLKEAGNINTSLLTLGRCIGALRWNQTHPREQPRMIPYRDSKLTRLFQMFLSGQGRTCLIVNISQCASTFDETYHVLKFSAIAKQVIMPKKSESAIMLGASMVLAETTTGSGSKEEIEQEDEAMDTTNDPATLVKAPRESSIGCRESVARNVEFAEIIAEYEQLIHKLKNDLIQEKRLRYHQEAQLREEICNEYTKLMVEHDQRMSENCDEAIATAEDMADERVELYIRTVRKRQRSDRVIKMDDYEDEAGSSNDEWVRSEFLNAERLRLETEKAAEVKVLKDRIVQLEGMSATQCKACEERVEQTFNTEEKEKLELQLASALELFEKEKLDNKNLDSYLSEAEATFKQKEAEINKLREELAASEKQVLDATTQSTALQMHFDTKQAEYEDVLALVNAKEVKIFELQEKLVLLQQQIASESCSTSDLVAAKDTAIASLNLENQKLLETIALKDSKVGELELECSNIRTVVEQLQEVIATNETAQQAQQDTESDEKTEALQRAYESIETHRNQLVLELRNAGNNLSSLQADLEALIKDRQTESAAHQQNIAELRCIVEQLQKQLEEAAVESYKHEETCVKQAENAKLSNDVLQEQLSAAQATNVKLSSELVDCKAAMEQLIDENRVAFVELERTKQRALDAEQNVFDTKGSLSKIGRELEDTKLMANSAEQKYVHCQQALQRLEENLSGLAKDVMGLTVQLPSHNDLNSKDVDVMQISELLQTLVADIMAQWTELQKGQNNLTQKIEALRSKLSQKEEAIMSLNKQLEKATEAASSVEILKSEMGTIQTALHKAQLELSEEKMRTLELRKEKVNSANEVGKITRELEAVKKDLKHASDELDFEKKNTARIIEDHKKNEEVIRVLKEGIRLAEENQVDQGRSLEKKNAEILGLAEDKKQLEQTVATLHVEMRELKSAAKERAKLEMQLLEDNQTINALRKEISDLKTATVATKDEEDGHLSRTSTRSEENSKASVVTRKGSRKRKTQAALEEESEPVTLNKVENMSTQCSSRKTRTVSTFGTTVKKSLEYICTGSPIADLSGDLVEETLTLASKRKRTLYKQPKGEVLFSPAESSPSSKLDPTETVPRQLRSLTKKNYRK